ncbi:unnamed protein product [Cyprideis torosa]|uniref:Uncharacterized protein n=1 Tax=Cyprideis torosa TaxID=163714 RepID=A0A7R8W8M6_9CRUS|nr:unnamed protein product [Cyprideis torosa]CAG0886381.1 unnamed protein product [Cyprideis torosa]
MAAFAAYAQQETENSDYFPANVSSDEGGIEMHSTDGDLDMETPEEELRNLDGIIDLTTANLHSLNAKFASYDRPPPLYLKEYEELTSKLHEYTKRRQELMDELTMCDVGGDDDGDGTDGDYDSGGGEAPKIVNGRNFGENGFALASSSESDSIPRSPMRQVIRIQLPDQQHTKIRVTPGQTLKDACLKALRYRKIKPESCFVWGINANQQRVPMSWDIDVSRLDGQDVLVEEMSDTVPVLGKRTKMSHNFEAKTILQFSPCYCCGERMMFSRGIHCRSCRIYFHPGCFSMVPINCESKQTVCHDPTQSSNNVIAYLISNQDVTQTRLTTQIVRPAHPSSSGGGRRNGPSRGGPTRGGVGGALPQSPPLGQRERSTSEPTVCFQSINAVDASAFLSQFGAAAATSTAPSPVWVPVPRGSTLPKVSAAKPPRPRNTRPPPYPKPKPLHNSDGARTEARTEVPPSWQTCPQKESTPSPPFKMSTLLRGLLLSPHRTRHDTRLSKGMGLAAGAMQSGSPLGSKQHGERLHGPTSGSTAPTSRSATASPTNTLKGTRPRSRSSDDTSKKILWMVGIGTLKLDLCRLNKGTPRKIQQLIDQCIAYKRAARPKIEEVCTALNSMNGQIPKYQRTHSDPTLNHTREYAEEQASSGEGHGAPMTRRWERNDSLSRHSPPPLPMPENVVV